jgi:hypothetical protein
LQRLEKKLNNFPIVENQIRRAKLEILPFGNGKQKGKEKTFQISTNPYLSLLEGKLQLSFKTGWGARICRKTFTRSYLNCGQSNSLII